MLTLTDAARARVIELIDQLGAGDDAALRIALCPGASPLAPEHDITLVQVDDAEPGDVAVEQPGFTILLAADAARGLEDATLEFDARAFRIRAAAEATAASGSLLERARALVEHRINPAVAAHGGRIELVDVRDDVAYVRMSGGCQGCGMAAVTLRQGVERMLREAIPEIRGIADVTDHAGGRSPFFAPAK